MISAVILTKNSARTIAQTLSSVSFCDEVIVVDDGSTDDTKSIVESHHGRFVSHPLNDDFAQQRNFGLSQAREEWVLFLDSDEVVTKDLADEIHQKITNYKLQTSNKSENIKITNGYFIKRQDVLWGKTLRYGETSRVKLLRLAKKNSGAWVRPVHEVWNVKGKTEELEEPLIHHPHQTVHEFLSDINRYSTLNAQAFYEEGVRVGYLTIIAYPLGKFIQNYFFRLGFLDGMPGLIVALMMSFHSFLTRGKLWELQQKNQK